MAAATLIRICMLRVRDAVARLVSMYSELFVLLNCVRSREI